jgi:hypothetical protein
VLRFLRPVLRFAVCPGELRRFFVLRAALFGALGVIGAGWRRPFSLGLRLTRRLSRLPGGLAAPSLFSGGRRRPSCLARGSLGAFPGAAIAFLGAAITFGCETVSVLPGFRDEVQF